jgi:hypothetical protein
MAWRGRAKLKSITAEDGIEMLAEIEVIDRKVKELLGTNPSLEEFTRRREELIQEHPNLAGIVRCSMFAERP